MGYVKFSCGIALDEDFVEWLKAEARLSNEDVGNEEFCEAMIAKWNAAPVLFGENWKEFLMKGV